MRSTSVASLECPWCTDNMVKTPDYLDLIGIPFRENGRSLIDGLDCTGLVLEMYHRAFYSDEVLFSPEFNGHKWEEVTLKEIEPMDVVFMHNEEHVALYIGGDTLLHSKPKLGVVMSKLNVRTKQITRIQRLIQCSP